MVKLEDAGRSEVADFFQGKSVFITGGTGCVGKALIEKLLRSCPGVGNIFVLIRGKRGRESGERLEKLLSEPIFDLVRRDCPDLLGKVRLVPGDITSPELGVGQEDLALMKDTVSVILHSAATVKFDEHLKSALDINVEGTQRVLQLAKVLPLIQAVVHVSTAYSNCERQKIGEEVYPIKLDPVVALNLYKLFNDQFVDGIMKDILGEKPNTYTLTKHLAEELVNQNKNDVPVCIVRPSIVTAAYKDPIVGYVDNMNGMNGLFLGILTGAVHIMLINSRLTLDIIPLDYVINCILAAAMNLGKRPEERKRLQVYNLSSYPNPFYFPKVFAEGKKYFFQRPFKKVVWYPTLYLTTQEKLFRFLNFFVHRIPAQVLDGVAGISGRKRIFMNIYRKLTTHYEVVKYFSTRSWSFECENTVALHKSLGAEDQEKFPFNVNDIDWIDYLKGYLQGLKKYVLKDESTDEDAKRSMRRMMVIHYFTECVLLLPIIAVLIYALNSVWV